MFPLSRHQAHTIERTLASSPGSPANDAAFEVVVRHGEAHVAGLDDADLPRPWIERPVPPDSSAIGLCLPLVDRGHLGAMVDLGGRARWFVVVDGRLVQHTSPSCRLLDDVCRRRLGLATRAPLVGTDWYWISRWLSDIRATLSLLGPVGEAGRLDIVTVAGLHPAVDADEFGGLDRRGITRFVIERHRDHAVIADWSCVRLDAIGDPRHHEHRLAVGLDDGAFSRWVSATSIPLSLLAEPLIAGCPTFALELVGAVISDVVVRRGVGSP